MVTAIIPNYNHARFLQRRLESVYGQSYPDLKVILLDDASTDDSREILETYRHHPRTQAIVYNEENSGSPFLQWQKGLELVETDWVWIAESDDWCNTGFLDSLKPGMEDSSCVLAYAGLYWAQPDGTILKAANPGDMGGWIKGKDFVNHYLFEWNRLQNAGMLVFRKSAAMQVSNDWKGLLQAGDYRLWAGIIPQGRVYGCGQHLCYMTRHPKSVTARFYHTTASQQEMVDTWWKMLEAGCINLRSICKKIDKEMVRLYILRNELIPSIYIEQREFWLQALLQTGNRPRDIHWQLRALSSKIKHFIGSQK